jgi:copper chaperone NosL
MLIASRQLRNALMRKSLLVLLSLILLDTPTLRAADKESLKPGPGDKCPVCGMFVAKYPDFVAVLYFNDGSHAFFDGVKDMMKYYFNLQKYNPSKKRENIARIQVTDYYSLDPLDGFKAFYVSGSDIYGPMGKELIPFEKEADAGEFLKDHKGKAVMRFQDINEDVMKGLD